MRFYIVELFWKSADLESGSAAQNPECSLGSCDGNIHAPDVGHEANACLKTGLAGTHTRHDDHVHLFALEAVHRLNDHLQASNIITGQQCSNWPAM